MEIKYISTEGWSCIETTQHIINFLKIYKDYPCLPNAELIYHRIEKDCIAIYEASEKSSHKPSQTKGTVDSWNQFLRLFFKTFEVTLRPAGCIPPPEEFDDGIKRDPPAYCGIYLVGATHFNPITREEFYWIKNGKANNIAKRMAQYDTHSPMTYQIDFKSCDNERSAYQTETFYHNKLKRIAINTCANNTEWFRVTREVYLAICKKGFSYFD